MLFAVGYNKLMNDTLGNNFIAKVLEESKLFDNFSIISAKLSREGYLNSFTQLFSDVFLNELSFALTGRLIRSKEHQPENQEQRHKADPGVEPVRVQGEREGANRLSAGQVPGCHHTARHFE